MRRQVCRVLHISGAFARRSRRRDPGAQSRGPCAWRHRPASGRSVHLKPAFSLVELVTVVSIIGILAAIAMPRFGNSLARYRVENAAKRLETDLKLMRDQAIHQSRTYEMEFVKGSNSGYSVTGLRHLDRRDIMKYEVLLSDDPYRVSLINLIVGDDDRIAFDGFGVPDSAGTITLGIGSYTKTVVVDADTGDIRINTP